jgi:hypothetical protein
MCTLQEDQIRFLTTINNKTKVRRSTRSLVIGKAKVMSYGDLQEARAKRAEKDAAKEAEGKAQKCHARGRGRHRRHGETGSEVLEAEAPEPNIKVARMSKAPAPERARASVVQMSGTPVAEYEIVPEPWRAPVARMY